MKTILRFYNQNRYMIWSIIVIVIGIILLIQVLDNLAYEKNKEQDNKVANNINSNDNIDSNYAVITGKEGNQNTLNVISQFVEYCNYGQVEEAYSMISDDCKEVFYPTLLDFQNNYYNRIFNKKRDYAHQLWITYGKTYTYRIDFIDDMLATGSPSKTSIVDYYTIIKDNNNDYKLNINKFVYKEMLNKMKSKDDITINIKDKSVFMDYEIYNIDVVNNTKTVIMLDDMKFADNIYVQDINEQKYYWNNGNVIEDDIIIRAKRSNNIKIEINKSYNVNTMPIKISFENILVDNKTNQIDIEL